MERVGGASRVQAEGIWGNGGHGAAIRARAALKEMFKVQS